MHTPTKYNTFDACVCACERIRMHVCDENVQKVKAKVSTSNASHKPIRIDEEKKNKKKNKCKTINFDKMLSSTYPHVHAAMYKICMYYAGVHIWKP